MGSESSILIHQCQQHCKLCVWAEHQPFILQPGVSPSSASSTTCQASDKHHIFPAFEPLHPLLSPSPLSLVSSALLLHPGERANTDIKAKFLLWERQPQESLLGTSGTEGTACPGTGKVASGKWPLPTAALRKLAPSQRPPPSWGAEQMEEQPNLSFVITSP